MPSGKSSGLSLGQVVAVTLGFLVASCVIFVFGMWVGKDLAERRLAQEERVIRGPIARATPADGDVRDPDITIYDRLRQAATPTIWSYALVVTVPPQPTRTPTSAPLPTRAGRTPTRAVPRSVALEGQSDASDWADAGWTVQVSSSTDPADAERLAARLKAKGYDAYTLRAPMRGRTWHRVRVGHFRSREEAAAMERRLKQREGLASAYVAAR